MPTPAKSWIIQLRRQKRTASVHLVSWIPGKTLSTIRMPPLVVGTGTPVGLGCALGVYPDTVWLGLVQMCMALCQTWAVFWTEWRTWWNEWAPHADSWVYIASDHKKWLCAHLLIPLSLLDAVPQQE